MKCFPWFALALVVVSLALPACTPLSQLHETVAKPTIPESKLVLPAEQETYVLLGVVRRIDRSAQRVTVGTALGLVEGYASLDQLKDLQEGDLVLAVVTKDKRISI
jgi:hypothetical protein